jgi:hypothetical protein
MLRYVLRLGVQLVCVRASWLQQSELTESWGFVTSHLTTGGQSVHPSFVSNPSFHLWPYIHPLKINGQYIYHLFNTQQFYVLPTQCIYVFCVDLRTNSDYFAVQHWLVGFYNWDGVCLLRVTAWVFIYKSAYFQSFKCLMSLWNSVSCGLECFFWQGWVSVSQSVSVIHIYNFCCVCCIESTDDYVSSDGIVRAYWLHNLEFNLPAMARDFSLMKIRPDWLWGSPKPPV